MSREWLARERGTRSRIGAVALILVFHVLLAVALLRHNGMPERDADRTPASYIAVAFIPAPKMRQAEAAVVASPLKAITPLPLPRRSVPVARPVPESTAVFDVVGTPSAVSQSDPQSDLQSDPQSDPKNTPSAPPKIDMASLRAAARQIDSERTSTATQRQREAEQLRSTDDSGLARAVRQAKRPDCQTKYSGGDKLNVFLLIPLAIETVTDKGCKW